MKNELLSRRLVLGAAAAAPVIGASSSSLGQAPGGCSVPAGSGRLRVQGNQILFGDRPIRLRGVNMGGFTSPKPEPSTFDFNLLARDWNANVVRIVVRPGYWLADLEANKAQLRQLVSAARAAGLFVIIDWHAVGFPDGYRNVPKTERNLLDNTYESAFAPCREFWRYIAKEYASDGGVIFELFNEPVYDPHHADDEPRHWGELRRYWTVLLAQDIRPRAGNVVLCAAGKWTHDLRGIRENPVPDTQVAYTWHQYPRTENYAYDNWPMRVDDLWRVAPIVVTEWGFCIECTNPHFRETPGNFGLPLINFMETRGMHWTAFTYFGGTVQAPFMLLEDEKTLTGWGQFVRAQLRTFNNVRCT